MKKGKIIIGSNFGDEGKGLMTDYFAHNLNNPIVIRFNGGSQAGHTVVDEKTNIRHVFGHFGAGSLLNIPTYLSKYFIVNPLTFYKEKAELMGKGINPKIYADKKCLVTIPYDMLLNQLLEKNRGKDKHGSCGLGINETMQRSNYNMFKITIEDIMNCNYQSLFEKMKNIRDNYFIDKFKDLDINSEYLGDDFIGYSLNSMLSLLTEIDIVDFDKIYQNYDSFIFEGAQGLMLHQSYKYFPHVTHSKTGIENALDFIYEHNLELDLEAVYITRSYLTRHGAGPLEHESNKVYRNIVDKTNIPNDFQGSLRFAPLDLDLLKENIENDFKHSLKYDFKIKKSLAITCLDQIDNDIAIYYKSNNRINSSTSEFIEDVKNIIPADNYYLSYGETRNTIKRN